MSSKPSPPSTGHSDYVGRLQGLLKTLRGQDWAGLCARLRTGGHVWVLGNGGSWSNASHLVLHLQQAGIPAFNLIGDVPSLTALSNDHSYASAPRRQLRELGRHDDLLVVLSVSADSENVVLALAEARRLGMGRVGVFGGGDGAAVSDCHQAIIVPSREFGPVEDTHSAVVHLIQEALHGQG